MAGNNDFIFLDEPEEEAVPLGFDDPPEIPEDPPADPDTNGESKEHGKDGGKELDPDNPNPDDKETPSAEPEKKQQAPSTNDYIGALAKKDEQINRLMDTVQTLQDRVFNPPEADPELESPGAEPEFTQEQWDDDPQGCTRAIVEHDRRVQEFNKTMQEREQENQQREHQTSLQKSHKEAWELSVDIMPELANHPEARKAWATIFANPQTNFSNDPMGPLKATRALRQFMKEKNLSFDKPAKPAQAQQANHPEDQTEEGQEESARRGAEDEQARRHRVTRATMHTGGRGGGKKTIQLTKEDLDVCEKFGLDPKLYAETLRGFGGQK